MIITGLDVALLKTNPPDTMTDTQGGVWTREGQNYRSPYSGRLNRRASGYAFMVPPDFHADAACIANDGVGWCCGLKWVKQGVGRLLNRRIAAGKFFTLTTLENHGRELLLPGLWIANLSKAAKPAPAQIPPRPAAYCFKYYRNTEVAPGVHYYSGFTRTFNGVPDAIPPAKEQRGFAILNPTQLGYGIGQYLLDLGFRPRLSFRNPNTGWDLALFTKEGNP